MNASTVEASFGSVGRIALRAQPTGTTKTIHSECDEKSFQYEPVDYVGEFEFHGEHGYAEAEATSLPLQVKQLVDLACGQGGNRTLGSRPFLLVDFQL